MAITLTLEMDGLLALVCNETTPTDCTILLVEARTEGRPYFPHIASIAIPKNLIPVETMKDINYTKVLDNPLGNYAVLPINKETLRFEYKCECESKDKPKCKCKFETPIDNTIPDVIHLPTLYGTKELAVAVAVYEELLTDLSAHTELIVGRLKLTGGRLNQGVLNKATHKFDNENVKKYASTLKYEWVIKNVGAEVSVIFENFDKRKLNNQSITLTLIEDCTIKITNLPPSDLELNNSENFQEDLDFRLIYKVVNLAEADHKTPKILPPSLSSDNDERGTPKPAVCGFANFSPSEHG